MELLILWIASVVASIGFDLSLAFKMFKDVADQGYKIDIKRLTELGELLNPEAKKMNTLALFVPIINIAMQFDKLIKYNNARPFVADQLRVMDCIIPLTKEEEESYSLKPTGLNAMMVTIKSDINEDKEDMSVSFTDGEEKSTIWIKLENGEFIITKYEGPVSKLPLIEQKSKLNAIFSEMGKELTSRMTTEQITETFKNGGIIDLDKMLVKEDLQPIKTSSDTNSSIEQTISPIAEQNQQLDQLRDYATTTNTPNIEEEKGRVLGKRRK